jgi:hypothetical protein
MHGALLAIVLATGGVAAPARQSSQQADTLARPVIEFPKTRFLRGEPVFFWTGVTSPGRDHPIPPSLWNSQRIVFTRPDGSVKTDRPSWPADGMGINGPGDLGFQGGWGLGDEIAQVGTWTVAFEFAGHRTAPVHFTVEDRALTDVVGGTFVFPSSVALTDPEAIATLTIVNRSGEPIRFPIPGQFYSSVSVRLTRVGGEGWSSEFFVPPAALAAATGSVAATSTPDRYTFESAAMVPSVVLGAGDAYRVGIPIAAAMEGHGAGAGIAQIPVGRYELTFQMGLQLLVGTPLGPWKDFAPIRLNVTSTTTVVR